MPTMCQALCYVPGIRGSMFHALWEHCGKDGGWVEKQGPKAAQRHSLFAFCCHLLIIQILHMKRSSLFLHLPRGGWEDSPCRMSSILPGTWQAFNT